MIEFQANGSIETLLSKDIHNYKFVSFGFDSNGEGTFKVCVYCIRPTNHISNNHLKLPNFVLKKQDEVTRKNVPVY
jgi:hypothetical protein